jgi:hypothetical protein
VYFHQARALKQQHPSWGARFIRAVMADGRDEDD